MFSTRHGLSWIEARDWYLNESVQAALDFLDEAEAAIQKIGAAPLRWPQFRRRTRRYPFRRFPYSAVYYIKDESVLIIAFAHGRRRPTYWKDRLN